MVQCALDGVSERVIAAVLQKNSAGAAQSQPVVFMGGRDSAREGASSPMHKRVPLPEPMGRVTVFVFSGKTGRSGALWRVVDGAQKSGKGKGEGMANGAAGRKRQEENIGGAGQVQVQAEKAQAILGCAGGLGQRFAIITGRKTAGIPHAGRGDGRSGNGCSMQGDKGQEYKNEGRGSEIEMDHAWKFTVACRPCQEGATPSCRDATFCRR